MKKIKNLIVKQIKKTGLEIEFNIKKRIINLNHHIRDSGRYFNTFNIMIVENRKNYRKDNAERIRILN